MKSDVYYDDRSDDGHGDDWVDDDDSFEDHGDENCSRYGLLINH